MYLWQNTKNPHFRLAAILKVAAMLNFLRGQSGQINQYINLNHHAKFGACIIICTILLKNAIKLLHYGALWTLWS